MLSVSTPYKNNKGNPMNTRAHRLPSKMKLGAAILSLAGLLLVIALTIKHNIVRRNIHAGSS